MGELEVCAAAEKYQVKIVILASNVTMRIYKPDLKTSIFLWYNSGHYENCAGGTEQMDECFIERNTWVAGEKRGGRAMR